MVGMLIRVKGYNYTGKDGKVKSGRIIVVQSSEEKDIDDGDGNFDYGFATEEIVLRDDKIPSDYLVSLLGQECEFKYQREVGDRYEKLISVKPVASK